MRTWSKLYIGGDWVEPAAAGSVDLRDAATEEVFARVPVASRADVDRAVAAASAASDSWSRTEPKERAAAIRAIASGIRNRDAEIAELITAEVGTPSGVSLKMQVRRAADIFEGLADAADEYTWSWNEEKSLVVREPIGVVAAISPWNFPLLLALNKVGAALAAGCPVVLKPALEAPTSLFIFAEIAHEVGLPPGVFNLLCGEGPAVGEPLAADPAVAMISFTGSTAVGRRLLTVGADQVKRVSLELGEKSAAVILDDADLPSALATCVDQCFLNSGQICFAWSRIIVPTARAAEAYGILEDLVAQHVVGDPRDPETTIGPLVSAKQRDAVRAYIESGADQGAKVIIGGGPADSERGFFVTPTVFGEVQSGMKIAQEEIFGPVIAVLEHGGDDDAVALANDTIYGLHGAVFSADDDRALGVARRMKTGQVDINGFKLGTAAPFGGYKQSGLGRELGRHGIDECTEIKAIQV